MPSYAVGLKDDYLRDDHVRKTIHCLMSLFLLPPGKIAYVKQYVIFKGKSVFKSVYDIDIDTEGQLN